MFSSRTRPLGETSSPTRPSQPDAGARDATARCGIFEANFRRREIRRKGVLVRLQQQPFEILRLLLLHPGEFVSRELIRKALWPDGHFVDYDRSINSAVLKLRRALRESARSPAYIETASGLGYR